MQNILERFNEHITRKGLKNTAQRRLIVDVFFATPCHLGLEELYTASRARDTRIGQTTVYRTLKLLCEAGLAKEMHFGDGITRYEPIRDDSHHDHLICTQCGKNIEVVDPAIEQRQIDLAKAHGFELTSHRMYLYGLCDMCRGHSHTKAAPPSA